MTKTRTRRETIKSFTLTGAAVLMLPDTIFTRSVQSTQKITFGILADSHFAIRPPQGTRYYEGSLYKMRECILEMNDRNLDFLIHLGDFKDESKDRSPITTLSYLKIIESEFCKFDGARYHCVGNHDVDSITKADFLGHISNSGIDSSKSYYSFDSKGLHFIVLDANFDNDGKDHYFKGGSDWQNTNIPENQLDWLKEDLNTTTFPTIIFCHHPLIKFERDGYIFHVGNYPKVQNLLERSGKVLAVFHGHVHEESYHTINGIHYITQAAMVDYQGLENNAFYIASIEKGRIEIKGFKRASDITVEV